MNDNKIKDKSEKRICSRQKKTDIFLLPSGKQLRVTAEMKDGIHHICINMVVNHPSLRIRSVTCDMISVPSPLCRQALCCYEKLIGRRVLPGLLADTKKVPSIGCTHLTNLFHDVCYNLIFAQGRIMRDKLEDSFPGITEAQILKIFLMFRPQLLDSCVRYEKTSPLMDIVSNSPLPKNANQFETLGQR